MRLKAMRKRGAPIAGQEAEAARLASQRDAALEREAADVPAGHHANLRALPARIRSSATNCVLSFKAHGTG